LGRASGLKVRADKVAIGRSLKKSSDNFDGTNRDGQVLGATRTWSGQDLGQPGPGDNDPL